MGKKPWEVVRDWKGNEDLMQFLVADSAQALEMKRRAAEMLALKEAEEQRLKDEAHVQKYQPMCYTERIYALIFILFFT